MAYGHAERVLAAIRRLEVETTEFLISQTALDPEQKQWLRDVLGAQCENHVPAPRTPRHSLHSTLTG